MKNKRKLLEMEIERLENGKVISADESWVQNWRCALGSEILYIEAWHHADRVEHPLSQTGLDVGVGRKSYRVSRISSVAASLYNALDALFHPIVNTCPSSCLTRAFPPAS